MSEGAVITRGYRSVIWNSVIESTDLWQAFMSFFDVRKILGVCEPVYSCLGMPCPPTTRIVP